MYKKRLAMNNSNDKLNMSAEYGNDQSVEFEDPSNISCDVSTATKLQKSPNSSYKNKKKKIGKRKLFSKSKTVAIKKPTKEINCNVEVEAKPEAKTEVENGIEDDVEYEVEDIIDEKKEGNVTLYRVRWKGYTAKDDSWLHKQDLGCPVLFKKYCKIRDQDKSDTFLVEAILDHRRLNKITYYLVHWKGFSSSENSWQSKDKLNCPILIKEYHEKSEDALIKSELLKKAALENAKKGNHEFEVEEIVGHQIKKGILSYLVRWLGWGAKDDTWVPENQLSCSALIKAYETRIKKESGTKKIKVENSGKNKKKSKDDFYLIDRILNSRINKNGQFDFLVSWKGYGVKDNRWIPENDLYCTELVDEFFEKNKIRPTILRKINGNDPKACIITKRIPLERTTHNSGGVRAGTIKGRKSRSPDKIHK